MTQTKAELLETKHQGAIHLGDANSSHYVGLKAPATVASNLIWTLPATDGTSNQFLKTDGSGNLSWGTDSATDNTKMPLAGGTFTGDVTFTGAAANIVFDKSDNAFEFVDDAKATFGTSADLSIYHNGSHSYVDHTGTGDLWLRSTSSGGDVYAVTADNGCFVIQNASNAVQFISCSAGSTDLYHNGTKKLETTANGITVSGNGLFSGNVENK